LPQDRKALKKCFKNTKVSGCKVANKEKRLPTPAPILPLAAATIAVDPSTIDPAALNELEEVIAAALAQALGLQDPEDLTVNVRAGPAAAAAGSRRRRDLCDTGVTVRVFVANVPEPLLVLLNELLEALFAGDGLALPEDATLVAIVCSPFKAFGRQMAIALAEHAPLGWCCYRAVCF